jgi:hypothetical protein
MLARGDGVCANGRDDGRVRKLRLGRDDAVCDEVVDALCIALVPTAQTGGCGWAHRVLLLLDFDNGAVLEGPLDNIGLIGCALDPVTLLESGPELAKVLELDQVPDIAEGRLDDGRLADGGGSGDAGRHYDLVICNWFLVGGSGVVL